MGSIGKTALCSELIQSCTLPSRVLKAVHQSTSPVFRARRRKPHKTTNTLAESLPQSSTKYAVIFSRSLSSGPPGDSLTHSLRKARNSARSMSWGSGAVTSKDVVIGSSIGIGATVAVAWLLESSCGVRASLLLPLPCCWNSFASLLLSGKNPNKRFCFLGDSVTMTLFPRFDGERFDGDLIGDPVPLPRLLPLPLPRLLPLPLPLPLLPTPPSSANRPPGLKGGICTAASEPATVKPLVSLSWYSLAQ